MKKNIVLTVIILLLFSCDKKQPVYNSSSENQDPLLLSVLWFQRSGEMKALYYQGYNIAKKSLTEKLRNNESVKLKAVIMDIDETVLDNSPLEAYQAINNVPFSDHLWKKWVYEAEAKPCPGALEFTQFAESLNVEVFYISNREIPDEFNPTLQNLINLGFPFADSIHLVLKDGAGSKESRRQSIAEKYDILILIGDNLADFDAVFDNREDDPCFNAVKSREKSFGSDYIILPNPMYGPWINAAIKETKGKNTKEKIIKSLTSF
jgi:5'-nucleotidase (lipoprotein e(P4) family)